MSKSPRWFQWNETGYQSSAKVKALRARFGLVGECFVRKIITTVATCPSGWKDGRAEILIEDLATELFTDAETIIKMIEIVEKRRPGRLLVVGDTLKIHWPSYLDYLGEYEANKRKKHKEEQ